MFLKCQPNPHRGGRMTRAIIYEQAPGQHFAIDAETLHKQPELLNDFGSYMHREYRLVKSPGHIINAINCCFITCFIDINNRIIYYILRCAEGIRSSSVYSIYNYIIGII